MHLIIYYFTCIVVIGMDLIFPDFIYKYSNVQNFGAQFDTNSFCLFRICPD